MKLICPWIRSLLLLAVLLACFPSPAAERKTENVILVSIDDVDWIEAEGNYVTLHCGEHNWMQRETISALEQRLDPARFCRIHRSAIVRLDRIRELQPASHGDFLVLMKTGAKLQMSRSYARRFKALG